MKQVTLSKFGAGVTEWFQVDRWTKELATEIGEQEAKAYVRVVKSGLDAAAQKENPKDAIKAVFDVLECGT
jgi:hypothetical protein